MLWYKHAPLLSCCPAEGGRVKSLWVFWNDWIKWQSVGRYNVSEAAIALGPEPSLTGSLSGQVGFGAEGSGTRMAAYAVHCKEM